MYWGRKPPENLVKILKDIGGPYDTILDPFCGGGTFLVAALKLGARVIGSDLNPMAVFLSKVILQPLNLFALNQVFEELRNRVELNILDKYRIKCRNCGKEIYFEYIQWNCHDNHHVPEQVKINCPHCYFNKLYPLTKEERQAQLIVSESKPKFWFPENIITTQRKTKFSKFQELFTGRNLTALAELNAVIEEIPSQRCRDFFHYVFTGALYSCSQMQMFSSEDPSSSRGWTAPRFYIPPAKKEKNVWLAFQQRFKTALDCKAHLNSSLKYFKISRSLEEFENLNDSVFIYKSDFTKFKFPQNTKISHILLDPPYNDDMDYMGFSEFWGSWLRMKFSMRASWHPGRMSDNQNASTMKKLLFRIKEHTEDSCNIILAYGAKRKNAWELMNDTITSAGYNLKDLGFIYLDNPHKRKQKEFSISDHYFLLKKETHKRKSVEKTTAKESLEITENEINEIYLTLRIATLLLEHHGTSKATPNSYRILEKANNLIRPELRKHLNNVTDTREFSCITSNKDLNDTAYNRLCITLLSYLLAKDGYKITQADKDKFDGSIIKDYFDVHNNDIHNIKTKGIDFVAENGSNKKILFCFYNKENEACRRNIATDLLKQHKQDYNVLHYLIFSNNKEMNECRQYSYTDNWPRGFFICLDEIARLAIDFDQQSYGHLKNLTDPKEANYRALEKIKLFKASVIDNIPVSSKEECQHYRLKIEAPELKYIVPGQFVMIDTLSTKDRKEIDNKYSTKNIKIHTLHNSITISFHSFLKRPFSIHRGIYKNFDLRYLKKLELPQTIAQKSHTVYPHRFEIFYKVLDHGVGTNELKFLKKGSTIKVLGPLGSMTNIHSWREKGIKEIHLVGGGVGMAPLIFFGQALKYYSYKIKAFIGIDKFETLLFSAPHAPTFAEDPENAYVYIENLLGIGLNLEDIFLSTEEKLPEEQTNHKLPASNCNIGFVTDQYKEFFKTLSNPKEIMIISCGPTPMMKNLSNFASQEKIPLKVLLEKRMACGIGVCMSCVCKKKKNDSFEYKRVCTDGPLFDANELVWD